MFVQNRSRSQSRDAAKAFQSHADEIERLVADVVTQHPELFTDAQIGQRVFNVKDGNTLASIINHEGCALSQLQPKRYEIYGQDTQANKDQIMSLSADINQLVHKI